MSMQIWPELRRARVVICNVEGNEVMGSKIEGDRAYGIAYSRGNLIDIHILAHDSGVIPTQLEGYSL